MTIYRLIQEGLTNVYKHAHAGHVVIVLERLNTAQGSDMGQLHLSVSDDGLGMQSNSFSSRFGLRGMRERVEMQGGRFIVYSEPECGLRFEAFLPDT